MLDMHCTLSALPLVCLGLFGAPPAVADSPIFPPPREAEVQSQRFSMEQPAQVLVPERASEEDLLLARSLVAELSDKHGVALQVQQASALPATGRFILMGTAGNPLVREYLLHRGVAAAEGSVGGTASGHGECFRE